MLVGTERGARQIGLYLRRSLYPGAPPPGGTPSYVCTNPIYSTVTDLARFRGLSMSRPSARAVW